MPKRILIIDNEPNVGLILKVTLEGAGYEATVVISGREGVARVHDNCPDLILLDIRMPGIDGWQVCRHLREVTDVPIIILTILDRESEIVKGLSLCADDYVVKPWSNPELLARVHAVLRRAGASPTTTGQQTTLCGDGMIDPIRREVAIGGRKTRLTPTELRVLTYLIRRSGRVVPYSELIAQIWGVECKQDIASLRWHMHNLRQKIERDPKYPHYLLGKRGIGYCFADQSQHSSVPIHDSQSR